MSIISVLLADNQTLTAAGLNYLLKERNDIRILAEVKSQQDLAEMLRQHQPDLLIVDYNTSGYVTKSDLADVRRHSPGTNILAISSDDNKTNILQVLQAGVTGYLTKECSKEEILMAIASVARGKNSIATRSWILSCRSISAGAGSCRRSAYNPRTEILKLLASGYSAKSRDELFLSPIPFIHTEEYSLRS